jgi:hypothetical protein
MDQGSRFFFTYKVDVDLYESLVKSSSIQLLCSKLKNLKKAVILWQRDKKEQLQLDLLQIESKMAEIFDKCPTQIFDQVDMDILKALKQKK